jgi:hypothetical protein
MRYSPAMDSPAVTTFTKDQLAAAGPADISDALEREKIVFFPECPIDLPSKEDLDFMRDVLPDHLSQKNPSYHAASNRLFGVSGGRDIRERAERILRDHLSKVQAFLESAVPLLVKGQKMSTASFRPVEEQGRDLPVRKRSDLVHFDAGAYGATHGSRILRFFVNVHPDVERVWVSKGGFRPVYDRFGRDAGVVPAEGTRGYLEEGFGDRLFTGAVHALAGLGLKPLRLLDSSPYDREMRRFHNWMKETPSFQETSEGHAEVRWPPFSSWMVFADGVSHACTSGRHAFIDTIIVPLENCRLPELAPMNVLKSGAAGD